MQLYSTYVAQLAKAKWYVAEPSRFRWVDQDVFELVGRSATHRLVRREDGTWKCDCAYARQSAWPCAHVRALEQLLNDGAFCPESTEPWSSDPSDQDEAALRLQRCMPQVVQEVL